jgi:hypothetical protein
MNEQIKQLELEAIAYADSKVPAMDRYNDIYHSIVRGKFAELLLKECMKLCTEVKEDLFIINDNDKRDLAEMAATFCYEAIKGEFGVEE